MIDVAGRSRAAEPAVVGTATPHVVRPARRFGKVRMEGRAMVVDPNSSSQHGHDGDMLGGPPPPHPVIAA